MDLAGFGNSSVEEILNTQDYANITELFKTKNSMSVFHGAFFWWKSKHPTRKRKDTLILLSSAGILAKNP